MSPSKIVRRYIVLICPRCGNKEKYPEKAYQPPQHINCGACLWSRLEVQRMEAYDPDKHRPPWRPQKR